MGVPDMEGNLVGSNIWGAAHAMGELDDIKWPKL